MNNFIRYGDHLEIVFEADSLVLLIEGAGGKHSIYSSGLIPITSKLSQYELGVDVLGKYRQNYRILSMFLKN